MGHMYWEDACTVDVSITEINSSLILTPTLHDIETQNTASIMAHDALWKSEI